MSIVNSQVVWDEYLYTNFHIDWAVPNQINRHGGQPKVVEGWGCKIVENGQIYDNNRVSPKFVNQKTRVNLHCGIANNSPTWSKEEPLTS